MKKMISLVLVVVLLAAGIGISMAQQYGGDQGNGNTLNLPSPPPKPQPNMEYGNSARAAIVGERMTDASQGNAKVVINEGNVITASVYLNKDASAYDIANTMANFTYMLADLYGLTEKANSDIVLKVYDTSKRVIIDAKFSTSKNAFDYFNVPEGASASPTAPVGQPGRMQPGNNMQPGRTQPGYGGTQPGYGQGSY
jgi:hypothetical protein